MASTFLINGLPAPPPPIVPPAQQSWGLRLSTLQAVAELVAWVQQRLGMAFDPALVEVLAALEPIHQQGRCASVAELAAASGLAHADVERTVVRLIGAGALILATPPATTTTSATEPGMVGRADAPRRIRVTPQLAQMLAELRMRLDDSLIARSDVRERHLLNRVSDARLAEAIDKVFDRFHELEWLHLHNWGANCYLMAPLVVGALRALGISARVQTGHVEALRGKARSLLGAPGGAQPGQVDGHAFCVVEERCVVDFGLGNARRMLNREFFWAVAADRADLGEVIALVEHPRIGRVRWHTGWSPPRGDRQIEHCGPVAERLLRENGFLPCAGRTATVRGELFDKLGARTVQGLRASQGFDRACPELVEGLSPNG